MKREIPPGSSSGGYVPRRKRSGRAVSRNDAASLAEIRRIVVGPEQLRLERLEERPVASADTIGDILPEAFARASTTREQVLAIALEPAMTTAVRSVARKDAHFLGEALAPTIGAAVRKAVSDATRAMLQKFNEALERSLSVRSMKWRIEARRTGCSFAEVVLLRTLVYRVEQVFLIHPTTGIVLLHIADESGAVQDPDQVASMLEAIDSFVREAFRPQPPGVHLNHVEVGDLTVWVDRDPSLALAAVVRGVAPRELSDCLYDARERVRLAYQAELEQFRSDVSQFVPARPLLEPILRSERRPPPRRAHIYVIVLLVVLAVAVGALIIRAIDHARLLRTYVETLEAVPGIVVTSAERHGVDMRIKGLRDSLAPVPSDVLERRGLTPPELLFEPFLSLDPQIVELRARQRLRPPPNVTLTLRDGTLRAAGVAPRAWITQARLLALALPGIEHFDEQALQAEEAEGEAKIEALQAAARALQPTVLNFVSGSAEFTPDTDFGIVRARWHELMTAADAAGLPMCVTIMGHADPTGSQRTNQSLSEARAAHVARALTADDARVRVVGAGIRHDAQTFEQARSVTFQVDVGTSCPDSGGSSND
jgi:outer membrane protein OmpA-like peptidoglycan-associated protein